MVILFVAIVNNFNQHMTLEKKIEVRQRKDRMGCYTANGILVCYCGKCESEDYKLPEDLKSL